MDLAEKSGISFPPAPPSSVLDSPIQSNRESQYSGALTTPPPSTQTTPVSSRYPRKAKALAIERLYLDAYDEYFDENIFPDESPLKSRNCKRRIETLDSDYEVDSQDPVAMNVANSTPGSKDGRLAKRPCANTDQQKSSENGTSVEFVNRVTSSERVNATETLDTNGISAEKMVDNLADPTSASHGLMNSPPEASVGIQPSRQSSSTEVRDLPWPRVRRIKLKMAFERNEQTTSEGNGDGSALPLNPNSESDPVSPRNVNDEDPKASEREATQETPMQNIDVAQKDVVGAGTCSFE